jgi:drug/metabolite transporter (DMT)-like permease
MLRTRREHAIAVLIIAIVAIVFGCGFAAMQTALRGGLSVGAVLSIRFLLGGLGLLLLAKTNKAAFDRRSVHDGLVLGVILVSIFWLQTDGLRFTTTAKSGLITSLYVPFTPALAFFLRDRVKLAHGLAALIATFGLYLLVHVPGESIWTGWNRGDFETLACALICTLHVTYTAKFSRRSDPWVLASMQVLLVGIVSFFIATLLPSPHGFQNTLAALDNPRLLVAVGFMVFFTTIFCFWGMCRMQAYLTATEAAVIFSLEPLVATVVGVFWVGEHLLTTQLIGAALIFVAMLTAELLPRMLSRLRPEEVAASPAD